ncbi:MAG: phage holin family protein [Desulfovibrionaceae bacterium]|nr:phage holin family protein [Desulfovibrionaceae bacterium]
MTDPKWLDSVISMFMGLTQEWPSKICIGAVITSICEIMGIDKGLLYVCFGMLTADMATRILVLAKHDRPLCAGLKRAIPRYIFYLFFIILAWTVQFSVFRAMSIEVPFTNLIIAYLILTDCASVIEHLIHLGVPVPKLIKHIVSGGKKKVEKTVKDGFDIQEEDLENEESDESELEHLDKAKDKKAKLKKGDVDE